MNAGLIEAYKKASEALPEGTQTDRFKLAVVRFVLDAAGTKDEAARSKAWEAMKMTHGSFGTNLSGFLQAAKLREEKASVEERFVGKV